MGGGWGVHGSRCLTSGFSDHFEVRRGDAAERWDESRSSAKSPPGHPRPSACTVRQGGETHPRRRGRAPGGTRRPARAGVGGGSWGMPGGWVQKFVSHSRLLIPTCKTPSREQIVENDGTHQRPAAGLGHLPRRPRPRHRSPSGKASARNRRGRCRPPSPRRMG